MTIAMEIRTTATFESPSPGKLVGYAAVFDKAADLGEFVETVKPGAFTRTLADKRSVFALYDHERRSVLGRTPTTLRLSQDSRGLAFELDLPDTTLGRDLAVSVGRGDISGCSFGFRCSDDHWEMRGDVMHRELLDVELHEITITSLPAYAETEVIKRSLAHATARDGAKSVRIDNYIAWLRTC